MPHNGADAPEEKGDGRSFGVSFSVLLKEIEMLKNTFVERGTFARLSPSKRIIRGVFGGALIAYFIWQLPKYGILVNTDFPVIPGKWIGMAILFYFFADVFNIGFNRRWGRWPHYIFLILVGAAILFDLYQYGGLWGPPAGWLLFSMQQFTAGMIGLGFILSAILASPG